MRCDAKPSVFVAGFSRRLPSTKKNEQSYQIDSLIDVIIIKHEHTCSKCNVRYVLVANWYQYLVITEKAPD